MFSLVKHSDEAHEERVVGDEVNDVGLKENDEETVC